MLRLWKYYGNDYLMLENALRKVKSWLKFSQLFLDRTITSTRCGTTAQQTGGQSVFFYPSSKRKKLSKASVSLLPLKTMLLSHPAAADFSGITAPPRTTHREETIRPEEATTVVAGPSTKPEVLPKEEEVRAAPRADTEEATEDSEATHFTPTLILSLCNFCQKEPHKEENCRTKQQMLDQMHQQTLGHDYHVINTNAALDSTGNPR